MKDSAVGPAGLLNPTRQKRLLEALEQRFRGSLSEHQALATRQAEEIEQEEQRLTALRSDKTESCRRTRRAMLSEWDEAEERLTRQYEAFAIKNRADLNRLGPIYRRKLAEGTEAIEHKAKVRCEAVHQQYNQRKDKPWSLRDREINDIDESLVPLYEHLDWCRQLTMRRLDGLPAVSTEAESEHDAQAPTPTSVKEAIESIHDLSRRCKETADQMQTGAASKIVDGFYLPAGAAVFIAAWALITFVFGPEPPWLMMAAGVPIAVVLAFSVFFVLMWPLKRMTRRLYPVAERIALAAEECAATGRAISEQIAKETADDMLSQRDAHLAAASRWKAEHLEELDKAIRDEREQAKVELTKALETESEKYKIQWTRVSETMLARADSLANKIHAELAETDQAIKVQRSQASEQREQQRKRLADRLQQGVQRGLMRISKATDGVDQRFPTWQAVLEQQNAQGNSLEYLPVGWLQVSQSLKKVFESPLNPTTDSAETLSPSLDQLHIPERVPVVLHRRLHSGLVISAPPSHLDRAIDVSHQVLWRLLTGAPAGRAKLTLIDPLGRGQNFTSFMALADHDPVIVGHRVWTSDSQINERLSELSQHVEDVLQASLRDRFERIEDYNELAGSMAEPYRLIAAIGFPEGLTRDSYRHLLALIESGLRCGIFVVIVRDSTKPWPSETPLPRSEKLLQIAINDQGQWCVKGTGLESLPLEPLSSPPAKLRNELVTKVGLAAIAASKVEIPLASILDDIQPASASTAEGIEIPVGSQGANRHLAVKLGEGVRQHVLIAGKTGSGKSTLLHAIITSGAYRYSPEELQYYLLDFKKGVEFKAYADAGLPHARVIGIESEREFGRSVLQRLDSELQQRGELFRAAAVQELGEYRKATGNSMPRIMLVVDEFQELFVRDDRLAGDCAMLLDRLVRQGRSFGMHVVLSSQSLAGAYSLPRATLGQMAVRIAMQCSESDAALILADDNTAARLISRPGEAIYNDAGGLIEGNQPFQVAWLSSTEHRTLLQTIALRDRHFGDTLPPAVIFEGNRPCRWTATLAGAVDTAGDTRALFGLLGEAVEIGPPVAVKLTRDTGRNLLVMAPPESRAAVLATCLAGFYKSDSQLQVRYFDGTRVDDGESLLPWLGNTGIPTQSIKLRDAESEMGKLSELIKQRTSEQDDPPPVVVVIDPLERFRDLRQDDSFSFSLDAAASPISGPAALQECLRDGPSSNVFFCIICGSAETLSRWLPRASQHDLELRVLGRMNASDSSLLVDSPIASELSAATMLLYDDADGRICKFRQCDLPDAADVKDWLDVV